MLIPMVIFAALTAVRLVSVHTSKKTPATSPEKVASDERHLQQGSADSAPGQPGNDGRGEPRPLPQERDRAELKLDPPAAPAPDGQVQVVVGTRDTRTGRFQKRKAAA